MAPLRPAPVQDTTPISGRQACPEAVPSLAHQVGRLVGPLDPEDRPLGGRGGCGGDRHPRVPDRPPPSWVVNYPGGGNLGVEVR